MAEEKKLKDWFGHNIPKRKTVVTSNMKAFCVTYTDYGYMFKVTGPGVSGQIELRTVREQDSLLEMLASAYEAGGEYKEGQVHQRLFGEKQ